MKPSGKTQARKKHRVRTRQTRSGLLRQTFAEKKRRVPGQADKNQKKPLRQTIGKRIIGLSPDKLQLVRSDRHFRKKHRVPVQANTK